MKNKGVQKTPKWLKATCMLFRFFNWLESDCGLRNLTTCMHALSLVPSPQMNTPSLHFPPWSGCALVHPKQSVSGLCIRDRIPPLCLKSPLAVPLLSGLLLSAFRFVWLFSTVHFPFSSPFKLPPSPVCRSSRLTARQTAFHCVSLYFTALYYISLHFAVFCCISLYFTVFCCIILHFAVLLSARSLENSLWLGGV